MFEYKDIEIYWYGHSCFKIKRGEDIIYIDPYELDNNSEPADIILITHSHRDHFSVEDIEKIEMDHTIDLAPKDCAKDMASNVRVVKPMDKVRLRGMGFEVVYAYNIDKFRSKKEVYHKKSNNNLGYIIDISGIRIYHAGDTDIIPEMDDVKCDIAMLPVSGKFTMDVDEAFEAVKKIRPKVVIPMHYGSIIGSVDDAMKFKDICKAEKIEVEVMDKD